MATDTVWVIYKLSDEDRAKVETDGGELPVPNEIWVGSLEQQRAAGYVLCEQDGTLIDEPTATTVENED
jgi:hypothetical protein